MKSFYAVLLCALASMASASELQIIKTHEVEGCERKSANGDKLSMHYTGFIDDSSATGVHGKQFDSSIPRGKPFEFVIGGGQVIKGWEEGLLDMCAGEKRTLIIPPELGYGERGAGGDIPGGATLRFTVQLMGFGSNETPNVFKDIDADGDHKISYDEFESYFALHNQPIPGDLWGKEDADQDRFISWAEFSGPKGKVDPTKEEL